MNVEDCEPASSKVIYSPQWILNTLQIEQGDKVCVHAIKGETLVKRGRALKIQALL